MDRAPSGSGQQRSGIVGTLVTCAALGAVLGWGLGILIAPALSPALALGGAMTLSAAAVGVVLLRSGDSAVPRAGTDTDTRDT